MEMRELGRGAPRLWAPPSSLWVAAVVGPRHFRRVEQEEPGAQAVPQCEEGAVGTGEPGGVGMFPLPHSREGFTAPVAEVAEEPVRAGLLMQLENRVVCARQREPVERVPALAASTEV